MRFDNDAGHRAVESERNARWERFIERVRIEHYGGRKIPYDDMIRIKREFGYLQQDGRAAR